MTTAQTPTDLARWRFAIFAIFFASGISIATWASRLPSISLALSIDTAHVGLVLVASGIASITGLSLAGVVAARIGTRTGMRIALLILAAGVSLVGLGADLFHALPVVIAGIVLFGFSNGLVDVLMNVEGAAIEQRGSRTILPLFHACFSLGTVAGAGIGALAAALSIPVAVHAPLVATIIALVGILCVMWVPSDEDAIGTATTRSDVPFRTRLRTALSAWTEPRTYALGLIVLGMSFAEGGANDWLALAMTTEGHGAPEYLGAAALATFSVTMTLVRALGGPLVDRFGRVLVLRVLTLFAAGGLTLFIFAPNIPLAFVGAALWGAGVSLAFPLGMSAAADDPAKAAARVSATATIGYVAFLCGPPVLGLISKSVGLLNTLLIIVGLAILSGLASGAARPLSPSKEEAAEQPQLDATK